MIAPASQQPTDVAFITVNYNTRPLVEEMVKFFRTAPLPFSHRLTVVDNASTDGSLEFLSSCPDVATLRNGENLGYGRAMNRGIAASRSKYLCLLNTDIVLNAEALTALYRHLENHPETGVASPRICYPSGRTQGFIFRDGILPFYFNLVAKFQAKRQKLRVDRAKRPFRVDGVMGAFIFLNRNLCSDGKLFDEDYFFYFEDSDLAHGLAKRGVRCEVLPDVSVVHLGGGSTSIRNGIQYYRSKYLYLHKRYGARHAAVLRSLERFRLREKVLFYRLLKTVYPSETVLRKFDLYRSISESFDTLTQDEKSGR
jgi:N-acetylglucosaminyl-diphospho-decaprenol L-rhamnosyltransferase